MSYFIEVVEPVGRGSTAGEPPPYPLLPKRRFPIAYSGLKGVVSSIQWHKRHSILVL